MTRINLEVSFRQKDEAKQIAQAAGTCINWDSGNRTWYWQGEGNLPQCLEPFKKPAPKPYWSYELLASALKTHGPAPKDFADEMGISVDELLNIIEGRKLVTKQIFDAWQQAEKAFGGFDPEQGPEWARPQ